MNLTENNLTLPRTLRLNRSTEDQLKKLKSHTGITPNVMSRIAFFISVESGFKYSSNDYTNNGSLALDKLTWLGDLELVIETLLREMYPNTSQKFLEQAWAAHVTDGAASFKAIRNLAELVKNLISKKVKISDMNLEAN